MKYLFGPVASRRLGRSLGVDLVPPKTCSHDCVYCEAGATTSLTLERREYVPTAQVIAELRQLLATRPELDYITFSGAGEPTLHSGIGAVIQVIKSEFPHYRCCVLTNGAGFSDPQLRSELAPADLVIPSLDATCEEEFQRINRPVPGLTFSAFLEGLNAFLREHPNSVWLEYFIVPGTNDSADAIARLAELMKRLRPEKIQLNTLDRPGTNPDLRPSSPENTLRFIRALAPILPVEAVGHFRYRPAAGKVDAAASELECRLLELALRRPITAADAAVALQVDPALAARTLDHLVAGHSLEVAEGERGRFYRLRSAEQLKG